MELLDIVDEHGIPTGKTVERSLAHEQGILHRTAHVWIIREKKGRIQVLLQKSSEERIPTRAVTIFPAPDIFRLA